MKRWLFWSARPVSGYSVHRRGRCRVASTDGNWPTRCSPNRPALPVLYTTGYTRNAIIHHGRLDADVQLLGKPYTEQDLADEVARAT